MKLARCTTALVVITFAAFATHADAKATKPNPKLVPRHCQLVTDPAGDANGINPGAPAPATHAGPSDDAMDILDINGGTSKTSIDWRLQLTKLALASADAPGGMFWSIDFTIRKTTFTVTVHSTRDGTVTSDLSYASAAGSGQLPGAVKVLIDLDHSQIRFDVLATTIAKLEPAPLHSKITGISAQTGQALHAVAYNTVDWTTTDGTYTPGQPARCATWG